MIFLYIITKEFSGSSYFFFVQNNCDIYNSNVLDEICNTSQVTYFHHNLHWNKHDMNWYGGTDNYYWWILVNNSMLFWQYLELPDETGLCPLNLWPVGTGRFSIKFLIWTVWGSKICWILAQWICTVY